METKQVYLGLGGNEGYVLLRLKQALALLSHYSLPNSFKISHFYHTAPVGVESSNWFVNSVCSFQTCMPPSALFKIMQTIESQLGKVHKPKNASRPIDIDFLFYDNQIWQEEALKIPHPYWKERLFVLIPLADLISEITFKGQTGIEHYVLDDLIQPLLAQSSQRISLLEKNPELE